MIDANVLRRVHRRKQTNQGPTILHRHPLTSINYNTADKEPLIGNSLHIKVDIAGSSEDGDPSLLNIYRILTSRRHRYTSPFEL